MTGNSLFMCDREVLRNRSWTRRRVIGGRCTCGNTFSRAVLIDPDGFPLCGIVCESFLTFVFDGYCLYFWVLRFNAVFPVSLAVGSHLIPSRTQQLSLPAPMILHVGKVGRCRELCFEFQVFVCSAFFRYLLRVSLLYHITQLTRFSRVPKTALHLKPFYLVLYPGFARFFVMYECYLLL